MAAITCVLALLCAPNASLALFGDGDVTGVGDVSGDAVHDIAVFVLANGPSGVPVDYMSGATGKRFKSVNYLDEDWYGIAMATVADSNADGIANDPAVAVLGYNFSLSAARVQVRRAADREQVGDDLTFLDSTFVVIDLTVIDDTNGDGNPNDPSLAVLGLQPDTWHTVVEVRRLSDGTLVGLHTFLTEDFFQHQCADGFSLCESPVWVPVAVAGVSRTGASPLIGVLALDQSNRKTVVESRHVSDGALHRTTRFFSRAWTGLDIAVLSDANGDGAMDDPAYAVLARHSMTGKNASALAYSKTGWRSAP
jgi:hypothetical protein